MMEKIKLEKPKWEVPSDPLGRVRVERGGKAGGFGLIVPDDAEFLAFFNELFRHWKMRTTLDQATKRYESGEANFTNAADNLDTLTKEIRKIDLRMLTHARNFWGFTDIKDKPEEQAEIEKLFEPYGSEFCEMIANCSEVILVSEDERKNSSRGRTELSPQVPPRTVPPASPSSSGKTESPSDPASRTRRSRPTTVRPASSSG